MTLKALDYKKLTFLTNSTGEESTVGCCTDDQLKWYEEYTLDNVWFQYLVNYNGEVMLAAYLEFLHSKSEIWGEQKFFCAKSHQEASYEEVLAATQNFAEKLSVLTEYDVLFGEQTGVAQQHEVAVMIPTNVSKKEIVALFEKLDDIYFSV